MKILLHFIILLSILFNQSLIAQSFYDDGSMIITKVSKDKKYGYKANAKKAIKVGTISNEYAYLKALRGPHGEEIRYNRIGSCCMFKSADAPFGKGLLDQWEIIYDGIKKPAIIYLNGYEYETPQAPSGFSFVTADQIIKPIIFPADSIVKVNFCSEKNIFSVGKDFLLKEAVGDLAAPDSNPTYIGGNLELLQYFKQHPLTNNGTENTIFKVTISFVINCNGKAGNFRIISKGKGMLETYANEVLAIVNKLPQHWNPAIKNGEKVDCYEVISFSVMNGKLDNFVFR